MFSHSQQNRPFYPTFNENRGSYHQPPQRPHTPLNSSNMQSLGMSRSLNKLPGQGLGALTPQNYNNVGGRNISRSKVSMSNSQASQLTEIMNEPDVFPD